ncbi:BA5345 family protein [Bacillus stercoris]
MEFEWQNELLKITDENKRNYIATRFSHLLSTTHSLGALCSLFISLLVNLLQLNYPITYERTLLHTGSIVLNCIYIILLPSIANQKYYSRNVNEGVFLYSL